jgi:hypothetical protein
VRYFVNQADLKVEEAPAGGLTPPNCRVIDGDTVAACLEVLRHGLPLTPDQAESLLSGDATGFMTSVPEHAEQLRTTRESAASPSLPLAGTWEYKVIPLTELLGFGTAKGTAQRMEVALNTLASEGWELVTTSERDSRWMSGETVLLTLRRFTVTEHSFTVRIRAEERLRSAVLQELTSAADQTEHQPTRRTTT